MAYTSKVRPSSNQLFSFSKLLVVVLGQVSVVGLVGVEDVPSARFSRYEKEIKILTFLRF